MNLVVISGKICSNIDMGLDGESSRCRFKIKSQYFSPSRGARLTTIVPCIAYGAVADYCYNEMWAGCDVIITGAILFQRYEVNGKTFDRMYIRCNTISKLEQEEYA